MKRLIAFAVSAALLAGAIGTAEASTHASAGRTAVAAKGAQLPAGISRALLRKATANVRPLTRQQRAALSKIRAQRLVAPGAKKGTATASTASDYYVYTGSGKWDWPFYYDVYYSDTYGISHWAVVWKVCDAAATSCVYDHTYHVYWSGYGWYGPYVY